MAKRLREDSSSSINENCVYRNENIKDNLFSKSQEMRRSKKLCDFEIKVGDQIISAHRFVLAASIPYFYKKFCSEDSDKKTELVLNEMDPVVVEKIVNYSYTGEIEIESKNLESFMSAAMLFEMSEIQDKCVNLMSASFDITNVLKHKSIAESMKCEILTAATIDYICNNFSQVAHSDEFLKFSSDDLIKLIEKDELNVSKEEDVYQAVMRWLKFDRNEREALLPDIFKKIRLTSISIRFLFDVISTEKLIKESPECCDILEEVKKYHVTSRKKNLRLKLSNNQPRKAANV